MNIQQKIYDKANKPMTESKKWLAAMVSVVCVMLVYFSGVTLISMGNHDVASYIVSLGTTSITFLGMVFSSLILGVSAVDWKSMQSSSEIHQSDAKSYTEDKNLTVDINYTEHVIEEGSEGAPEIKPYAVINN